MDCAYDNRIPGKQVKIYANKLKKIRTKSSDVKSKQYTCPYCGAYVQYYHEKKQKAHFRHIRGSFLAKTCDKYVSGTGISTSKDRYLSDQKLSGFPLYIRKFDQNLRLFIGLLPVPEDIIDYEINNSQEIEIKNPDDDPLDRIYLEDLIVDEITYKSLDCLYESYSFRYKNKNTQLISECKWVIETPGIGSEGALFSCSDMFSRRIAYNGEVTTDKPYYLVTTSKDSLNGKKFLNIESNNKLAIKPPKFGNWYVYKIKFTEITKESSEFVRDLNLTLVGKTPKLTPLWPPHIQQGNQHIHKTECQAQYLLQSSKSIKETKLVKYVGKKEFPVTNTKINSDSSLIKIKVTQKKKTIPLERENTQFSTIALCKPSIEIPTYSPPTVTVQYNKKDVLNSEELKIINNSKLSCKSSYKCIFCYIRNNYLKSLITNELTMPDISDIKSSDRFLVIHGLDIIKRIYFPPKNEKPYDKLKKGDNQMYQTLIQLKGKQIATPVILKYALPEPAEYPKVKSYILNSLHTGKISKPAYDYIINNITGGITK